MKTILTACMTAALLFAVPQLSSAVGTIKYAKSEEASIGNRAEIAKKEWRAASPQEKKAKRQGIRQAIRDFRSGDMSEDTLLLVIITILIPPLGMYLYEGEINNRFWLSLVLTLLLYLPGLIYTLIIILGKK